MTSVYKSSPLSRTAGTPLKEDFRGHLLAYSASIFCSLPSSPESRIHHNFSRQISDDDV
ncbi:hypothetical protein T08_14052 [Trichinella sp. T8]|nr:hypothetical protein T08_14052 [Trichinella sp. T8]